MPLCGVQMPVADTPSLMLSIELCWIGADPPVRESVWVPQGATVGDALLRSTLLDRMGVSGADLAASLETRDLTVAVYGRRVALGASLTEHDRIELLPALRVDPKRARARRAEHRRRQKGERRWAPDRA